MANVKFELINGIKVGEFIHKDIEIKELNLGEMYDAEQESETLKIIGGKAVMVSSPSTMTIATLRRQIVKLGDLPMPVSEDEFMLLSMTDIDLIRENVNTLEQKSYAKVIERGRALRATQGG